MNLLKKLVAFLFAMFLSMFGVSAFATPPDFTSLTTAVDYSTAISAILLVAAGLAGVAIVVYGIKLILPMIAGRK